MGIATRLTNIGDLLVNAGQSGGFDEFTGAPVVDSSLVLWLDAGQTASYPGTGTTWTDLSGNGNTGTLTNGPTYNSNNGGAITLDGGDDIIACGTFSLSYLTISTWVYKTSSATNQGICRKNNNWAVSQYNGTLQVAPGTSWMFYDTGYTIPLNTWVNIVYTYSGTGVSGTQAVYINGSNIWNGSVGTGPISPNSNTVRVGYDDNSWYWGGQISNVQLYNRPLSAAEVQKNYNALAPRYGLPRISGAGIIRTTPTIVYASELDEFTGVPVVDSSLVLWVDAGQETSYPGTGTTWTDLSGNGNTGTLVNVPTYNSEAGGSLVFDGVDDYIDCGNNSSLSSIGGTTNITVSAWVYHTAYGGGGQPYSVITVKGNPWTWLMENPSNTFRFRITAGGADVNVGDTSTHLLNTWYNVVGTYDGSNIRIYVNGVLKNTQAQTGTLATNAVTAKIGTFQGTNYNLTGRIANVSVYNRTFSAAEIQQNYNALAPRYELPPVNTVSIAKRETSRGVLQVAGKFDEFTGAPVVDSSLKLWLDVGQPTSYPGTGTTWTDLSGNGNTVTLVNGPSYSSENGGSIAFDGVNDVANSTTSTIDRADGQEITVSCWIKPSRTSGQYSVFCTNRSNDTGIYNWIFYQHTSDGAIAFHGDAQNKSSYVPTINTWINVTNTVTASGVSTLYVNGISTYIVTGYTYGNGTPSRLGIGADPGGQEPFQGNISNVQIYHRALTADEISTNFNALRGRYGI